MMNRKAQSHVVGWILLVAAFQCVAALGYAHDTPTLVPVPSEAQQADAKRSIESIFARKYEASRNVPESKLALAKEFVALAIKTEGQPAARYVLLREACILAAQTGDSYMALDAVDQMTNYFAMPNALEEKTKALAVAVDSVHTETAIRKLATRTLILFGEAVENDNYETATRLVDIVRVAAQKTVNEELLRRVRLSSERLRQLEEQYEQVKASLAKLKKEPNDPAASFAKGKYLCLAKGDWENGLPLLALGDRSTLKSLAVRELSRPTEPIAQLEIGDAWWDLAMAEGGFVKKAMQSRARFWFQQAAAGLSGLTKARVEQRMRTLVRAACIETNNLATVQHAVGELKRFEGHESTVRSIAVVTDGRQVLSASYDRTLRLWDLKSGREVRRFEGHTRRIRSLAVSSDGGNVLSGSDDRTVRLWDVETAREIHRFEGHTAAVTAVALSPGGRYAVSGSDDGSIRVWEIHGGRDVARLKGHRGGVRALAFSADAKLLASAGRDRLVRLWDVSSWQEIRHFAGHTMGVYGVAISPDARQILSAGYDSTIRLWEIANACEIARYELHEGPVSSVAFSPYGTRALSAGSDGTVRLWDVPSGHELNRFAAHSKGASSVAFLPDGHRAVSSGEDNIVRVWGLP